MAAYMDIIDELMAVSGHPGQAIAEWKRSTGKPVAGLFPVYAPEELVYAAGLLPAGLWGGSRSIKRARAYIQPFACSIMQSILEMELDGTYDLLDAVLIPSLCDTLKCMGQKWKGRCPAIPLTYPQNRAIEPARIYLEAELEHVKQRLEQLFSVKITDRAIEESIDIYNENRELVRRFAQTANDHLDVITPKLRHGIIKARLFMDKREHSRRLKALIGELNALPVHEWKGKRILLTGITAEPNALLDIFSELDLAVVGDDLAQESRQVRTPVPGEAGRRPLRRLAEMWCNIEGCSLAFDPQKKRGSMLLRMAEETKADAVVVCMMKFCDPEEFDYAVYNTQLDEKGLPHIVIEIDQEASSFEQLRTRLQSLSEVLK